MKYFEPWRDYPDLAIERLVAVANIVREARNSAAALHDPEAGDNSWSLHCRGYIRQCNQVRRYGHSVDWLTISTPNEEQLEFTLCIGATPLKVCRGEIENCPSRHRAFSVVEEQLLLQFPGGTLPAAPLRMVVATDARGFVRSISLVEFDSDEATRYFDIPLNDGGFSIPQPDPVEPPPIRPIELDGDSSAAASA